MAQAYLYEGCVQSPSGARSRLRRVTINDMPLECFADVHQLSVERALSEFRAARPVAVRSGASLALAFPAEGLTEKQIVFLQAAGRNPRLIVPGEKARSSAVWEEEAAAVRLNPFSLETIEAYTAHRHGPVNGAGFYRAILVEPDHAEAAALSLSHLSLLLPAVIVADASAADLTRFPVLWADADDILAFRDREARSLKPIARTFVPLDGAGQCEFVVFRGGDPIPDIISEMDHLVALLGFGHQQMLLRRGLKCDALLLKRVDGFLGFGWGAVARLQNRSTRSAASSAGFAPRYTTVPFIRCPSRPTSTRFPVSRAERICGNNLSTSSKKHWIISRTMSWLSEHRESANSGSKTTAAGRAISGVRISWRIDGWLWPTRRRLWLADAMTAHRARP